MEPERQVEIQLGHLCNNRCLFCVSGQRTAMGEARPMAAAPILERLDAAYAAGHRKLTLLGGEPTLQPAFLEVVQHAVDLGFEEIVVFTNGVRTARAELVDAVLATGGRFTWRISIQGATEEAHCRTTGKPRSFQRILRTLAHLRERDQRVTVNMCVVGSNVASVPRFPELVERWGVEQLHLDLMRPLDAGERSEAELRAMMPPYSEMAPAFEAMIEGFRALEARRGRPFDVNIGNLPYCVAPRLIPWTHHDGEHTETIAIDGDDRLSQPWNKYLVKRCDKLKPERCRRCLMHDRCSGVFETYARFHGTDELVPIDAARLAAVDPERRLLTRHLRPLARRLRGLGAVTRERGEARLEVRFDGAAFALDRAREGAAARYAHFGVHVLEGRGAPLAEAARQLADALEAEGLQPEVPLSEAIAGAPRTVAARLERLARRAPFVGLAWRSTRLEGDRAELALEADDGGRATLWLGEREGRARGGYEVDGEPTPGLVAGLRALLAVLRPRRPRAGAPAE